MQSLLSLSRVDLRSRAGMSQRKMNLLRFLFASGESSTIIMLDFDKDLGDADIERQG